MLDKTDRRTLLAASMFTAGYALAVSPLHAAAVETDAKGVIVNEVRYKAHGGYKLPAYVARPKKGSNHPAIIVVSEVFGVHAYIKDVCRRLAKLGYVAIAPDYFDRLGDPAQMSDLQKIISEVVGKTPQEQVMGDTAATIAFLKSKGYADSKRLGITGFCWGGNVVWMAAAKVAGIKAGVAWYGRLKKPASGWGSDTPDPFPWDVGALVKAPVLGLYGEKDSGIPLQDVEDMRAALSAAGNPTGSQIIVYPGAEHGFHADYRPSYNEAAAKDGWTKMLAWFRTHGVL